MTRKRSKMTRYSPASVKALRDEMAKHPNRAFGEMVKRGRMTDSDVLDFALGVASAYFTGELLEPVAAAAVRQFQKSTRRAVLVTAAKFDATAIFDEEGTGCTLKSAWSDDPITHIDAIQRLVDTGLTVAVAMEQFPSPTPKKGTHGRDSHAATRTGKTLNLNLALGANPTGRVVLTDPLAARSVRGSF